MWMTVLALCVVLTHAEVDEHRVASENKVVSTRLVSLSLDNCKKNLRFFKRSHMYRDLKSDEFRVASPRTVQEIDLGLGEYLAKVAETHADAKKLPYFTKGIQRIRRIRHVYGGQFIGVSRQNGQQFIIGCYSIVEDIDEFYELTHVPYSYDGDGANFFFQYDPVSKAFSKFRISGSYGGPFGAEWYGEE